MSLDLTPEQKAAGKTNFEQAAGDLARAGKLNTMATGDGKPLAPGKEPDRRDILKASLAVGAVVPVSAAVYFGYSSWNKGNPVRMALIGCGDEGGVLVGDHNPEYNKIVAVCDIRPTNLDRIFDGDTGPRKGLKKVYPEAEWSKIQRFTSLSDLLAKKDELKLEAVIIATPLNTHDAITKACMDAGLHVMCEKLMARTIKRCKEMTLYAQEKGLLLSIGHQRHYSTLYATALEMLENGILGDIKYIRALWHRNNSWPYDPKAFDHNKFDAKYGIPAYVDSWWKEVQKRDADALPPEKLKELAFGDPEKHGFKDVAELVRWRCSEKTGGGLMAELGSHQLDASSIILGHVRPLAVMGVGGKFFYGRGTDPSHGNDRESDDGVFVTFEFPGRTYYKRDEKGHVIKQNGKPVKDPANENDVVVVTFSSFNTNEFEGYGEWVMGSKGTMFLDKEGDVYLWREKDKSKKGDTGGRDTKITVTGTDGKDGKKPVMDASSTWGGGGAAGAPTKAAGGGPAWDSAVRGYRTELEHFAFCVREWQKKGVKVDYSKDANGELVHKAIIPRCHGEVAMADAILALTANMAMARRTRIEFEDGWFEATKEKLDDVPEAKYGSKKA